MKTLLFLSFLFVNALAFGYSRLPQRTVMFGGYYGRPFDSRSYIPEGSMSFASGDTIATNSFVRDQEEITQRTETSFEEIDEKPVPNPRRIPKRKPPVNEEDSDEEQQSSWPFGGGQGYNAFFPIMIGGTSGLGRRASGGSNSDGFYPGSATAIANSFSTGKGGVATSHATSFGDPYLSTLFRNGGFNKKSDKPVVSEE